MYFRTIPVALGSDVVCSCESQIKKRFDEPVGFGDERMLIERVGMRVSFKQDGQLGSFSLLAFFRTLTVGMMIFALITWSLDIVCTRFMPVSHKYEEAKYEFTENIYNLREVQNPPPPIHSWPMNVCSQHPLLPAPHS